ncbi:MAG TPA: hypothetical protein VNE58_18075 [Casimicrobiaceae bacterium]|nr:hypothetical protein [Casimicrobiaceae bacterium]
MMLPPRDLAIGTTYLYGVMVGRVPGSPATATTLGAVQCEITTIRENRNPTSAPFDAEE